MEKEPPMTATATDQQNAGNVRHERQARSVAIDFLRAIAILAVVSVHTLPVPLLGASLANSGKIINGGGISLDSVLSATSLSDSSSTLISAIIGSTSKVGVPLFLIISGYLMLDRDYTGPKLKRFLMHNYLPMFVSFECWCAIAFLIPFRRQPHAADRSGFSAHHAVHRRTRHDSFLVYANAAWHLSADSRASLFSSSPTATARRHFQHLD